MPNSTLLIVVAALVVMVLIAVLVGARNRRDRATEPVRLGPSWSPPGASSLPPLADPRDDDRVPYLVERSGIDERVVATVLSAWDEYLAVLGIVELPVTHTYRVYDPYDPPVAERRDGRAVPDPVRVARDVDRRTKASEPDARAVLEALLADPDDEPVDARTA